MAAVVAACALAGAPARGGQLLEQAKPFPVSTMAEVARMIRAPLNPTAPFIQLLEPGFAFSTFQRDCSGGMDFLPDGDLVCLNYTGRLFSIDANGDGTPVGEQVIAQLPSLGIFWAFVKHSPDGDSLLVAESSFGRVYTVTRTTGAIHDVATLNPPYPFDAIFLSNTDALISSANSKGGTTLIHLNTATGRLLPLANLSGPSGPLALDRSGNLYYVRGTFEFPAPPGSSALLRFNQADVAEAVQGTRVLNESDAQIIATLDSGFNLMMNHFGDIFVTYLLGPVNRVTLQGAVSPFAQTINSQFALFTYAAFYQPTYGFSPRYRKSPARLAFFLDDFSGHQQVIVVRPAPRGKR